MSYVEELTFAQYLENRKTRAAVERELQIISEAAYRLAGDAEILCPGIPWHEVRAIGNVLRHGYHAIHDELIWKTIHSDLATLKTEVNQPWRA